MKWIAGLFIAVAIVPGMARAQQTTYGGAYYPTYGSPNSLQFQAAKTALDLETVDPEGDARLGPKAIPIRSAARSRIGACRVKPVSAMMRIISTRGACSRAAGRGW